ncbi:MAG TPA: deoxyribodipyrimidine photo-lyase [Chitinophagaceae bacterium]|nr:deoxyribodipyrimidine photo-lyase [Chitinophagaceae bacterium]
MKPRINIMWFRRDLRLVDNAALYYALRQGIPVIPIFVFDRNILDTLGERTDRRVEFIYKTIESLQTQLAGMGSSLRVFYDKPLIIFEKLVTEYGIEKVFTNADYEQYALDRDKSIREFLRQQGIAMHIYKDQVIFDGREVLKDDNTPYTIFTPYSKKWKATLAPFFLKPYPTTQYFHNFFKQQAQSLPSLEQMGFKATGDAFPSSVVPEQLIKHYAQTRDYPAIKGTSRLSVHLRFGTVSIRQWAAKAKELNDTFLNELIWRDFYHSILWHFPHVRRGEAFKKEYDAIRWRNNEEEFKNWCKGQTGYPIVDAGMRELNATGYMHNRVRMITASFLTKHLLVDWRWGEAYFAQKLLDYDFAANNGGWQWSAGCGCDAAPYFRIFSPAAQTKKFDPELKYIRKWVPELDTPGYSQPVVNHEVARQRVLQVYKQALKQ